MHLGTPSVAITCETLERDVYVEHADSAPQRLEVHLMREAIRCHQMPSEVIRGHQRSSEESSASKCTCAAAAAAAAPAS